MSTLCMQSSRIKITRQDWITGTIETVAENNAERDFRTDHRHKPAYCDYSKVNLSQGVFHGIGVTVMLLASHVIYRPSPALHRLSAFIFIYLVSHFYIIIITSISLVLLHTVHWNCHLPRPQLQSLLPRIDRFPPPCLDVSRLFCSVITLNLTTNSPGSAAIRLRK